MKTLFINCNMGAAGDMLTAALLELMPDRNNVLKELNQLGIPHVEYFAEESVKCGIKGTHISVKVHGHEEGEEYPHHNHDHHDHAHHDHEHHDHEHHDHDHHAHSHHHSSMADIHALVNQLSISEKVKKDVIEVYELIAAAESHAHGMPVSEIHFHEVGTLDAVADVTAVCYLIEKLAPEEILASNIHVGSGTVKCAHGILPVPAPATAYILRNVPTYGGEIKGELCTPTGAALLRHFVDRFTAMPPMRTEKIGYGMGKKDFPQANCVRVFLGETASESVYSLSCNLDDMTGEEIGLAVEQLSEAGALDVFTMPIGMKKSRPAILLTVICKDTMREEMVKEIFRYTTTLGIRETPMSLYKRD